MLRDFAALILTTAACLFGTSGLTQISRFKYSHANSVAFRASGFGHILPFLVLGLAQFDCVRTSFRAQGGFTFGSPS